LNSLFFSAIHPVHPEISENIAIAKVPRNRIRVAGLQVIQAPHHDRIAGLLQYLSVSWKRAFILPNLPIIPHLLMLWV
jgi:hypothetical protein